MGCFELPQKKPLAVSDVTKLGSIAAIGVAILKRVLLLVDDPLQVFLG